MRCHKTSFSLISLSLAPVYLKDNLKNDIAILAKRSVNFICVPSSWMIMHNSTLHLLIAAGLTALSLLFTIISVSAPGWGFASDGTLFKCQSGSDCSRLNGAGVLLIIAIIFLAISIVLLLILARGIISMPTNSLKSLLIVFLVLAAIFIVSGYSRALIALNVYSYQLAVAAAIFTFLSGMIVSYWAGRSWKASHWSSCVIFEQVHQRFIGSVFSFASNWIVINVIWFVIKRLNNKPELSLRFRSFVRSCIFWNEKMFISFSSLLH